MGERIPFFLMPNGLAAVEAAAGFVPASPTVVDMMTKGCRKLSCPSLEPKEKSNPLLHNHRVSSFLWPSSVRDCLGRQRHGE